AAAKRRRAREAAKQRVEQLGAEGAIEATAFLGGRRNEKLGGGYIREAKITRKFSICQLAFRHGGITGKSRPIPGGARLRCGTARPHGRNQSGGGADRAPQPSGPQRTAVLVPRFGARIRRGRGNDYPRRHR